jgi:hypothetical protein
VSASIRTLKAQPFFRIKETEMFRQSRLAAVCVLIGGVVAAQAQEGNWKKWRDPQSKAAGNCPECQDGEAMAVSTVGIPNSGYVDVDSPPCGDPSFNSIKIPDALKTAASAYFLSQSGGAGGDVAKYAVGFSEQIINAAAAAASQDAGTLGQIVRKATNQPQVSSCGRALVTLPKEVDITRMVPTMNCPAGGWCALATQPAVDEISKDLIAANVVGKNWSHNQSASVTLKVFYKRPK